MTKKNLLTGVALRVFERRLTDFFEATLDAGFSAVKRAYQRQKVPGRAHPAWGETNLALTSLAIPKAEAKALATQVLASAPKEMTAEEATAAALRLRQTRQ